MYRPPWLSLTGVGSGVAITSTDGGATWTKQKEADRTWFALLRHPVDAAGVAALHWPFETPDFADAGENGGDKTLRQLIPYPPVESHPGNRRAWGMWSLYPPAGRYIVAVREGKTAALRGFDGSVTGVMKTPGNVQLGEELDAQVHADYSDAPDARVLPPPGGPAIVPVDRPEDMLVQAIAAMKTGVWSVDKTTRAWDENKKFTNDRARTQMSGLISGTDFELVLMDGEGKEDCRMIGIEKKTWKSTSGGKTWWEDDGKQGTLRTYFTFPSQFIREYGGGLPLYESAGTEDHDGETWLHIRPERGRWGGGMHYWLMLDKAGKPLWVRRCAWDIGEGMVFGTHEIDGCLEEDFTPAKDGEKIAPPEVTADAAVK